MIGELTLVESSLGALLVDIREAISDYGPVASSELNLASATTGKLADEMLAVAKQEAALFPADLREWLKAVKTMAEQRNTVVHALGRDRCITCGASSVFEHKGKVVDRSPERVRQLIVECQALLYQGVKRATELSHRLNERLVAEARARARETGQPQTPAQVRIAGLSHQCASCHESGSAAVIVAAPAGTVVLPPGIDGLALFRRLGGADDQA